MSASTATEPAVPNETTGTSTRYTKDGRKISYTLSVQQQPERARACGQGAKSSSDRRPVDPPPIVELHITEGDEARDITFMHNASLFLYATLEAARPIATGRMPQTSTNVPVLTGSPVAGISYLDRPTPAGYFIFPDLSVRHEGKYRLNFKLYEELKDPRDVDAQYAQNDIPHFYPCCEVKSKPFDVFSAKKFPGLMESTILSRVVADQGCRVRIRRDIRMRRRDSNKDRAWGEYVERATVPPLTNGDQEKKSPQQDIELSDRSAPKTNATTQSMQPPSTTAPVPQNVGYQSHPYGFPMNGNGQQQQQQQQQAQPSMYGHSVAPYEQQYSQQQYQQQPQQPQPQQTPQQQQPHYQPPMYMPQQSYPVNQYSSYPPYGFQQSNVASMAPSYGYQQQMMPNPYNGQQQYVDMRHDAQAYGSGQYGLGGNDQQAFASQAQINPGYSSMEQQPMLPAAAPSAAPSRGLPPLKAPEIAQPKTEPTASPMNATASGRAHGLYAQADVSRPPPPHFYTQPASGVGAKRSYGSTFNTAHFEKPLRSGARPRYDGAADDPEVSDEDLQDLESLKISYRRADGSFTMVEPRTF